MGTVEIEGVAERALGLQELRPGQGEAVDAVTQGRDVLAVLPTGAGKSAIYQIAGAMLDGPTVVVSPLIALQHDQVEAIAEQDTGRKRRRQLRVSAYPRIISTLEGA